MAGSIFTGSSQFSADFQNVVTRSVAIASLPLNHMRTEKTELEDQSTALDGLQSKFGALQHALEKIDSAMSGGAYEVTVSSGVASAAGGPGATEGVYSIEALDIGAYATSLSSTTWTAAPGAARTLQLSVGDETFEITPADNTAAAVAAAINAKAGGKARATVVNVGSTAEPDFRLSLQATRLGDLPVSLRDGETELQTQKTAGREAQYIVNNSGVTVNSESRNLHVAEGLTVTLLESNPGHPVEITVTRSTAALAEALEEFTAAYNDAVDAIDEQRGVSAGPLSGQSILYDLRDALSGLASYTDSESGSMSGLGLELGRDGKLTFNAFLLMASDISNSNGTTAFMGGLSSGGFLKAAADALDAIDNPVTGMLTGVLSGLKSQVKDVDGRITEKQEQVDALEVRLLEQMAAADAAIASMEQQYSYLSSMFEIMSKDSE